MWEKIKNILYRNLNMSFGLSGLNKTVTTGEHTGEWSCLQILTPFPEFVATIDGVEFLSAGLLDSSANYTGVIIYGRITTITVSSGTVRLYAGTNLGL